VVHIGSKNGFLEGAGLIFKAETASGDHHGQMNSKVMLNLPLNSVIVMDNAPYHGQEDKPRKRPSTKP
jgi:hypothetical protein